jgi:hypothetical protein
MAYNSVTRGSIVETLWDSEMDDGTILREWGTGTIRKVHRYDDNKKYVVCDLKCDDGTVDKSAMLKEEEYGQFWRFPKTANGQVQDDKRLKDILGKIKTSVCLSYLAISMNAVFLYYMVGERVAKDITILMHYIAISLNT